MKVSYRWLQDYVDIPWQPSELADKLTMVGLEVESVEKIAPELPKVYVGEIINVDPHPNGNLNVCEISIATEILTIVCGAPNVKVGMKVPLAVVGAVLPNGMEIKAADLRGVTSYGMACSEAELGLGEDDSGLMELPDEVVTGELLIAALGLDDVILDISIYANRPDCMSILGIAREVAVLANTKLKYPESNPPESQAKIEELTSIKVEDPKKCPRYSARLVRDIEIKESPLWMQQRLIAAGMRPINNVVDITNFVMLETGQPLHAFDYDTLSEQRIVVRTPNPVEQKFVTLDGVERTLNEEMLLICDAEKPACVAGVMGGEDSEVSNATKNILLESANFAPANIRRTARKLAIPSEAVARFEKGIDPSSTIVALNRAAVLLAEYANAEIVLGIIDVNNAKTEERSVSLRPQIVNDLLGTTIPEANMKSILTDLEFIVDDTNVPWIVTVPSFRRDLELECDLIEEIGRFWGFDRIPVTLPHGSNVQGGEDKQGLIINSLQSDLVGAGLSETLTYSFTNPKSIEDCGLDQDEDYTKMIQIANPLTEDHAAMRTSLIPSLLDCAALNVSRKQENLSLFEFSSVYISKELPLTQLPREEKRLGLLLYGLRESQHWSETVGKVDLYDLKGLIEMVLSNFDGDFQWVSSKLATFHPGRQGEVKLGNQVIARFGELHPNWQKHYRFSDRLYLAEVNIEALIDRDRDVVRFTVLPKFPAVDRDMALVISEEVLVGDLIQVLKQAGGELLKGIDVFDLYQGKQVETGKKSVAFSLVFQGDRTLKDEEVNRQFEQMYHQVKREFGAIIR